MLTSTVHSFPPQEHHVPYLNISKTMILYETLLTDRSLNVSELHVTSSNYTIATKPSATVTLFDIRSMYYACTSSFFFVTIIHVNVCEVYPYLLRSVFIKKISCFSPFSQTLLFVWGHRSAALAGSASFSSLPCYDVASVSLSRPLTFACVLPSASKAALWMEID